MNIEMAALSRHGSSQTVQGATHMSLAYSLKDAQASTDWILSILDAVRAKVAR
jgi:hypothetical protein